LGWWINIKLLQASFSQNELTSCLQEVSWGLVLVCPVGKSVCFYIVPKFANCNLCKSSLVGYIFIALPLQDKFKIVAA